MAFCVPKKKFTVILFLSILAGAFIQQNVRASERYPLIGLRGGYTHISGYYGERLSGGPSVGLYIHPYRWRFIVLEFDNDFSYFPIKGTDDSYVFTYSLAVGPGFSFDLAKHIAVYAGTLLKSSVFYAKGRETGRESVSFKVGFCLSGGVAFPLKDGFGLRLGYVFSENDLSRKLFMTHTALAGCYYAFKGKGRKVITTEDDYKRVKDFYTKAEKALNSGDYEDALTLYKKVQYYDKDYGDTRKRITHIESAVKMYNEAIRLKKQGDRFAALKILRGLDPGMNKAQQAIDILKKEMNASVKSMVTKGIKHYNAQDYKEAVEVLEKVLLIDPEHRRARLYRDRAVKSYKTLKKLR